MNNLQDNISDAKNQLPDLPTTPPKLKRQSSPNDLKERLDWGEPALTIIDIRDREEFHQGRIMGAIHMPMDNLVEMAKSNLEYSRDIYIYGESNEQTAQAANTLREAGFQNVAELQGGLPAWKAIDGSAEGVREARVEPGSTATNLAARAKDAAKK
ncbi:MAG: rhodanese-like domain-containing protein [Desertifilum sp. SIO1I2]|nr:rhodanese-like domain-containing protein [Desertifilum sp. SIO1I2]